MSKNTGEQIDVDEKKVIRELQNCSKESIDSIAQRCGFSRNKVSSIIKRLEENKTIWGYNAVIDDEQVGLKKYLILLTRTGKHLPREKLKSILNGELKQSFERHLVTVDFCYYVHGCYDFALCVTSRDVKLMKQFCATLNTVFEECFSDIQLLEVIFPLQKSGFDNPDLEELIGDFSI